jgi:acetylornithine/N-succinyldiaminopimelate aminotransferase
MVREVDVLAPVTALPRLLLVRGEGSFVWDKDGKRYLDFTAGLGCLPLGHARPELTRVLAEQFGTLGHCSNLYANEPALALAARLVQTSFADKVWFTNSGTEANEAAIKFARLHGRARDKRKSVIVAMKGGFHGRTLGALAITHHPSYRTPFGPLMPGVRFATFNNAASVRAAMDERVAAIVVEPVQGEGGVVPATREFLLKLRKLCDAHNALLVLDEVQCGLGRLGHLYAHEAFGITPDVVTLAKPLASGLPLGAVLVSEAVTKVLAPGQHGSTFAGGPAVCAVANHVFETVRTKAFLDGVVERATQLEEALDGVVQASAVFASRRGLGLMQALVVAKPKRTPPAELVAAARKAGLLVTRAGDDAVRLLPPLNCSAVEIEECAAILARVGSEWRS